jgi:hypothetical protein
MTKLKKPRYRRGRQVPDPTSFNVYDGRVWGNAGDGIRVVMYHGEERDGNIITGLHLPELDNVEYLKGIDDWYSPTTLPRRVRRALVAEYPKWLGEGALA